MNIYTKWMWLKGPEPSADKKAIKAEFVREFEVTEGELADISSAVIKLSADSKYKLYVNDLFVCYGPARGDRQVWYYDEPDILPFVKAGKNRIRIEVLYYRNPTENINYGIAHGACPGLFFDSDGCPFANLREQNENGLLPEWKGHFVCGFNIVRESEGFSPLMIMEHIRGAEKCADGESGKPENAKEWTTPFLYNAWQISNEVSPGNLMKRPIPFMYLEKRTFELPENSLIKKGETKIFTFDAGAEETGFVNILLSGNADIKLLYSESFYIKNNDGKYIKKRRDDSASGSLLGFSDICENVKCYSPFWYRTFRYIELTVTASYEDVNIENLYYYETGYPLSVKTSYTGNDATEAKIWDISLRTLKRCMQETYIDCPFYEQLQYVMDTRSQALYTYEVSGDDRLAREAIRAFAGSQRYDGLINAAAPSTASNVIPGFSIYFILMISDHLNYFNDRLFARQFLGNVDRVLDYFDKNIDERGLVGKNGGLNNPFERFWSFIDWTKEWNETNGVPTAIKRGPVTMESLLYIMGLTAGAEINRKCGREDTAKEYEHRAENVRNAVRKYCISPEGFVTDGPLDNRISQHCQVFAALTDILPGEQLKSNLEETLEHEEKYAKCSVAMLFYLLRAMEKTGLYEKYFDKKMEIYRWMLDMHLTTCVEDDVRQRSDCHGWGAVPLYELKHERKLQ